MDIKGMQKHKEQNVQDNDSGIVNIRVGYEFFQKCVNDYSNPIPWIWAREIIQNSVDAGATEIDFTIDENTMTAADNGHGMNADVIINKFLTLGASQKNDTGTDGELAVGGFGKAKEVVCFTWKFWSIDSRPTKTERYYVDSQMIGKKPIRKDKGTFTKGTEIKIDYTNNTRYDMIDWKKEIRFFVKTCTTKCVIRLNGEELQKLDARGTKKEYDLCTLRVNKAKADYNAGYGNMSEYCQIFIRIGGITMFRRFISTQIPALVTLDLKVGDVKNISLEMLNSSRESLQWKYQNAFDRVIEEILVNPRTIVSRNDDLIKIDKYAIAEVERIKQQLQKQIEAELKKEEEEIQKQEYAAQTASDYMDIDERKAELEEKRELKEEEIQAVGRFIETTVRGDKWDINRSIKEVEKINPAVGKMLRMTIDNRYNSDMGYTFVVHKHGDKKPSIDPKSEKAQTILHSWKLVVDKLMQRFHSETKYVVGLTFDPEVKARYVPDFDGECHILINPTSAPKFTDAVCLGHWIYIQATHEVTHNSASNHNEDFTLRWGTLLEEMSKNPNDWVNLFRKAKQESDIIMKKRKQAV